jgi:signal transduction histidine kinase
MAVTTARDRTTTVPSVVGTANEKEADVWLEMFALFIHDIESPLASMKYILKLLNEGKLDLDRPIHAKLVRSSQIAVARAESILYDVLLIARSGKAGIPVNLSVVDPVEIIEEAKVLAEGSAEEQGIRIEFTRPQGAGCSVMADPSLLRRSLDNLLFNAIRHTPHGGVISIYCEDNGKSLYIHVKDSGPGLGDVEPEQLFEKYGQVLLRSTGKHRGVGMGLYFCRLAATVMGGTVIAADHPDGGAVFSLRISKTGEKTS